MKNIDKKNLIKNILNNVLSLNTKSRRLVLIFIDSFLISFSLWISCLLIENSHKIVLTNSYLIIPLGITIGIPIYILTNHYKGVTRYEGSASLYKLSGRNLLLIIILAFLSNLFQLKGPNQYCFFISWLILTYTTGSIRFVFRDTFNLISRFDKVDKKTRIAIYGASNRSAEIANALIWNGQYEIITFIDDTKNLIGLTIKGIKILSSNDIVNIKDKIDKVLLSSEDINKKQTIKFINKLKKNNIAVLKIPSVEDILSGKSRIDELKPINISDLLFRNSALDDKRTVSEITDSSVLITGAGGSIGSEICRQVIEAKPRKIVVFDQSEFNLYKQEMELKEAVKGDLEIIPILGDAANFNLMNNTIRENNINTIFHAAAYKHVPLVETNILTSIYNNVFSTYSICTAARDNNVQKLISISTDKAVRPSNFMGASKRLSELIVQAFAEEEEIKRNQGKSYTNFAMVRFGNVLNSSGSVIPLFKKQIMKGGPITITHRDITRFFMTIREAASLVIEASELAKGGDVFILDMSKPIKIKKLAEKMITQSGLTVKDDKNPYGDIEIKETGLRPGEKLYEELLIDEQSLPTKNKLIFRAKEKSIKASILWPKINELRFMINNYDLAGAIKLIKSLIPEWTISETIKRQLNE